MASSSSENELSEFLEWASSAMEPDQATVDAVVDLMCDAALEAKRSVAFQRSDIQEKMGLARVSDLKVCMDKLADLFSRHGWRASTMGVDTIVFSRPFTTPHQYTPGGTANLPQPGDLRRLVGERIGVVPTPACIAAVKRAVREGWIPRTHCTSFEVPVAEVAQRIGVSADTVPVMDVLRHLFCRGWNAQHNAEKTHIIFSFPAIGEDPEHEFTDRVVAPFGRKDPPGEQQRTASKAFGRTPTTRKFGKSEKGGFC